MFLFKAVIDFFIVLLLLRLMIRPNDAFFHPIYKLIYRITDPVLVPAKTLIRGPVPGTLLTLVALVVLRGAVYVALSQVGLLSGIGASFMGLVQLLFQAYMVMWFISLLTKRTFGSFFSNIISRAFTPFESLMPRFGIPRSRFHLFVCVALLILYAISDTVIRAFLIRGSTLNALSVLDGLGEGVLLTIGLFIFPGFFSLVIIIGALLSWVSPDPSNPVVQAIYGIGEPLLSPFRRLVPLLGGLDISPIIAILCFHILGAVCQQLVLGLMKAI